MTYLLKSQEYHQSNGDLELASAYTDMWIIGQLLEDLFFLRHGDVYIILLK
jgi:hypothetical protein